MKKYISSARNRCSMPRWRNLHFVLVCGRCIATLRQRKLFEDSAGKVCDPFRRSMAANAIWSLRDCCSCFPFKRDTCSTTACSQGYASRLPLCAVFCGMQCTQRILQDISYRSRCQNFVKRRGRYRFIRSMSAIGIKNRSEYPCRRMLRFRAFSVYL